MTTAPRTPDFVNGNVSFWHRQIGMPTPRPSLPGDRRYDVVIVGAGYTGLWTAYYLKKAQPDLRVVILESEFAGFGASGRNGGWLSAEPPGQLRRYAAQHGWAAAIDFQQRMFTAVDEVIDVCAAEGIDADIQKDGLLHVATNRAQEKRLREHLPALRKAGWGPDDLIELTAAETAQRIRLGGGLSSHFSPHCARIQPAKLASGLADVVERLGVDIFEQTRVTEIRPREAVTAQGTVTADYVIRATEGFTAQLKGAKRVWLPMNSSMVVTEPLPADVWGQIGWDSAELVGDGAHSFCYMQRTADGRIVLGGRGIPYRFGSRTDDGGNTHRVTQEQLRAVLQQYFPAAADAALDHAWSGVLGVPRDWCASVSVDHTTGLGWAGGYVGHGVTGTNLAGRTLRDLVLRHDTDLAHLPWVDRRVRGWEPEPARWIGVRSLYVAYRAADRQEFGGTPGTSPIARIADKISGR
ncbi:NAD(P)/FAD-dependent oxidoreductase [Klenkia brasiliensis]|jgi:glycine/D-amino acid oxidase-like deaminating enzyme|uniref:Glycine/D-amino acid oxidase n=1 Tax=Klenkia brasiliensis TaxID=333142 RepID=A0A1G7SDP0_9ACTN|nr:FAD-dependent oxidoreductase [Klenkia brasiliensis]SDG21148.1 Glycine/D-amino acid oxidase [Klenkia brasiliensis]